MSVATLEDITDIQEKLAEREAAFAQAKADWAEDICPEVRPLLKVVESYVDYIQNPEGRIMLGIHDMDLMMRGIGKGELCFVFGQLHQGKTQLVLNIVAHNHDKRILYYTPDEMAEEVFTKLVAIKYGVDAETLEARIKAGDQEAIDLLKQAATQDFTNLGIVDESMGLKKLNEVCVQMEEDLWEAECDLIVIDYLGSIPGYADEGMAAKALKGFVKNERRRVLCIQQGHKDQSKRGKFQGVHGMLYGGQNEANFLIEVVRPGDAEGLSQFERIALQDVLGWKLWKNKRPPCKKGGGQLYLHPTCGSTCTWGPEHAVAAGAATRDALTAVKANNVLQLRRS